MTFKIGDRIRTLINLTSATWAPEQPDIPAGSLGTIDHIGRCGDHGVHGYGVVLDASVNRLSAWMGPADIEAAK